MKNDIPKKLFRFGDTDDINACYACGCLDFNEDWDSDGLDWFVNIYCEYCGRKQGWWYKKQYLENLGKRKEKKIKKHLVNQLINLSKDINRNIKNKGIINE